MLGLSTGVGTLLLFFVAVLSEDVNYVRNAAILCMTTTLFNFAQVFYNAYIPLLAAHHPDVMAVADRDDSTNADVVSAIDKVNGAMSAKGFAFGFAGQFIFMLINIGVFFLIAAGKRGLIINIVLAGIWVALFGSVTLWCLHSRPGPPLPAGKSAMTEGLVRFKSTLRSSKKLTHLFLLLLAHAVYGDGMATMNVCAVSFATAELHLKDELIIASLLMLAVFAVVSCVFWTWMGNKLGWSPKSVLSLNIALLCLLPIYMKTGCTRAWEFYLVVAFYGFNYGSILAFSRHLFSGLIPKGHEAEYFSFYQITDKASAWLGPLVVGCVNDIYGSYRVATMILILFFIAGIICLYFFDEQKALEQKKKFEEEEEAANNKINITVGQTPAPASVNNDPRQPLLKAGP